VKKKNKLRLFFRIGVIAFFAIILALAIAKKRINDKGPSIYAKGKIVNYEWGGGVSPWFEYMFYLHGNKYEGQKYVPGDIRKKFSDSKLKSYVGKWYAVKVNKKYFFVHDLLIEHPLDSTITQPAGGWVHIPPDK